MNKRQRKDSDENEGEREDGGKDFMPTADEVARLTNRRFKVQRRKAVANEVPRKYNGRGVIRIASWNLLCFSKWKARNLGVREVVCMTILENGYYNISACAHMQHFQIRDELNNPTTPNVKNWKGHRGKWECVTSTIAGMMYRSRECNGFLWDTSRGISLRDHGLLQKRVKKKREKKDFARKPFIGYFKVSEFDFVLVSVHLKATGLSGENLSKLQKELDRVPDILEALNESMPDEKDIIITGDFNLSPSDRTFDGFREAGFFNTIDEHTPTNISRRNPKGSKTYDNMWIFQGDPDKQEYTGRSGVCREGLQHEHIPHNTWEPNGLVSDHCLIWSEFFYGRDYDESSGNEQLSLATSKRYKVENVPI